VIIIGEKINATLPRIKNMIENRDADSLVDLARKQAEAGANYVDINVGTGSGTREDEVAAMRWAVETVQAQVDTPLSIDSGDSLVLEEGLSARNERPSLINSTKAEEENLNTILALAKKYNASVVALAMTEEGIPKTVEGRLGACEKIAAGCERHDVPLEKVFFDPLVLPVATDISQGTVSLQTIAAVKGKFPTAKTTMGLSNISFGLPKRKRINEAFLHMAVHAGLDSAIMDPLNRDMVGAVRTAEALLGRDRHCRRYTRFFRN